MKASESEWSKTRGFNSFEVKLCFDKAFYAIKASIAKVAWGVKIIARGTWHAASLGCFLAKVAWDVN